MCLWMVLLLEIWHRQILFFIIIIIISLILIFDPTEPVNMWRNNITASTNQIESLKFKYIRSGTISSPAVPVYCAVPQPTNPVLVCWRHLNNIFTLLWSIQPHCNCYIRNISPYIIYIHQMQTGLSSRQLNETEMDQWVTRTVQHQTRRKIEIRETDLVMLPFKVQCTHSRYSVLNYIHQWWSWK